MESNGVDPTLHPNVGFRAPSDVSAALKAARQSARLDSVKQQDLQYTGATPKANVTVSTSSTVDPVVNKWLHEWTSKCNGQSGENKRQIEVLEMIAHRVKEEAHDVQSGQVGKSEPLQALVYGKPGTGKSFVMKAAGDLFQKLTWQQGRQYQFAAFQAVVADQIQGDTLHHVFGINDRQGTRSRSYDKARHMCDMRWLIIDEISQVTAELLAACEKKASQMIQSTGTYKNDKDGNKRNWGGLNVIYVGDFCQLPPPTPLGSPLDNIPDEFLRPVNITSKRRQTTQSGLNLLWNGVREGNGEGNKARQGRAIELVMQMRCEGNTFNMCDCRLPGHSEHGLCVTVWLCDCVTV